MNNVDRNFDDISDKFSRNIYGTTKGKIREIIVWQELEIILAAMPKDKPLKILDAGGGQGQISAKLAKLGHHITLCDISIAMLKQAQKQHELEAINHIKYLHTAIQDLGEQFNQQFDLIICHAVLEWVASPIPILEALKRYLKPNGYLSLMFYNYHSLLFKTITLGNFGYTQTGLAKRKKRTLSPDYPRIPEQVYQWLADLNLTICQKTGIRLFHDYLIDKTKQQSRFDELLTLEKQYCHSEPYLHMARYILITANKQES